MNSALELVGSILLALGGGTAIVYALSKHLANLWTQRTLDRERAVFELKVENLRGELQHGLETLRKEHTQELELLVRRREVYSDLAHTMRVFVKGEPPATDEMKLKFLAAYDQAAVWATDLVGNAVGEFIDLNIQNTARPGAVSQQQYVAAYNKCVIAMREDSGLKGTGYHHRMVAFEPKVVAPAPASTGH